MNMPVYSPHILTLMMQPSPSIWVGLAPEVVVVEVLDPKKCTQNTKS